MQLYLPEDLYRQLKARGLPASELLQTAVRAELRRQDLLAETERYLEDVIAAVGQPSEEDRAQARRLIGKRRRARSHEAE